MRASPHRVLSVLVLASWMAPGAGALGVALHVALDHHPGSHDHHGSYDGEPSLEVSNRAHTATHGHRHDLDAGADHEHEARVEEPAPALRSAAAAVAVVPAPAAVDAAPTERTYRVGSPRRAPPDPLFTTHCSLLL